MDVSNPPSRSRESRSTGTNLRSTVFIACLAFPAVVSLLELLFFVARSSPCPAEGDAGAATIAYPSLALAPPSPGDALDGLPSEDVSLRAFHGFLLCSSLPSALNSTRGFSAFFLLHNGQNASQPDRGVPDASQQSLVYPRPRFCSRRFFLH